MSTTSTPTTKPTIAPITFDDIFANNTVVYLFSFLAIYIVLYFILGMFFSSSSDTENSPIQLVRILDIVVLLFIVISIILAIRNDDAKPLDTQVKDGLKSLKTFAENPYSIVSVFIFIIIFYASIYLVRLPMTSELKPVSIMLVENIAIITFCILLMIYVFKYVLNFDILNFSFNNTIATTSPAPTTTPVVPKKTCAATPTKPRDHEVFNIRNNLYTYDEAKEVCSIYGAKLANYEQIEESYKDGGEWCNYGWSEDQLALFPTQKSTWDKLQGSDATKHACGRPGINGGFIKNKNIKYGVNCYGKKPEATDADKNLMNANIEDIIPVSDADRALQAKINMWKTHADKFLLVNSFDKTKWSEKDKK